MVERRPPMPQPAHVGELLADLLSGLRRDGDTPMLALFQRWEALVGPDIAANARPVGFKGPLLLVHVASSVWMQQLQFLKAELIDRINAGLPDVRVSEIRFKIGPV